MKPLFAALALTLAAPALAQDAADPRDDAPESLVITYKVAPHDRPDMRRALAGDGVAALDRLKRSHVLAGYTLLWGRYADQANPDAILVARFDKAAPLAGWRAVEEGGAGGLPASATRYLTSVSSAPTDLMRSSGPRKAAASPPTYLAITYDYTVTADAYLAYVDGYIVPQMRGWIGAGALRGYDVHFARFAAARPWSSLLLLAYDGDAGLGRRDATTRAVRRTLANDPKWKAFADSKANVREVRGYVVADVLAER